MDSIPDEAFENLTGLDQLPAGGFTVVALPMKIAGGSGGPLRIVAILPAAEMERLYPEPPPSGKDLVEQGRDLYRSYGCNYCHTQLIRGDQRLAEWRESPGVQPGDDPQRYLWWPTLTPDSRFGLDRPSRPEEYAGQRPPFLGTQRTGPDLMAVGTRLPSRTWHYWHLYDPQAVSPDSNMPGLPWLFHTMDTKEPDDEKVPPLRALEEKGVPRGILYATPEAQALVEYLVDLTREGSMR